MHEPLLPALTVFGSLVFSMLFAMPLQSQVCADCAPPDEATTHFLAEAERGVPLAMTRTALHFFRQENEAKGEFWLKKAVDAGEPGALKIVADLHANGLGGYQKDRKRALGLYHQALMATTGAQAEKSSDYPPRYLLALKSWLSGTLGEAIASGEEGTQDLQEAARLFAKAELYPQLAKLLSQHPELDFSLDSLSPESLRELVSALEFRADDDENSREDRLAALRLLIKLHEEDGTGVHLAAQQRKRWERSFIFARYAEDAAAAARLEEKLQTAKPIKPARTRAASGQYSDNNVELLLLDNGRFYYVYAYGIAGRGVQVSLEGAWKEAAKGQVCLTLPPSELALFGRLDAEKALDPERLMSDAIHLNMDRNSEQYSAKVFLSWKTGARDEPLDDFSGFAGWHFNPYIMDAGTSALMTALSVGNRMHVYRYALDPRYNDYVVMVKNPMSLAFSDENIDDESLSAPFAGLFKGRVAKRRGMSFCGALDDEKLERQEFSSYARLFYEKVLEDNDRLAKIWRDGKSWTRVPAEDLGLRTLNIPENED
ncbi:MAG: hypothetical protein LBF51_06510 [Zoogloeaceae bacterium]|jgi:hypothetical protein|nr:hypothetical protein [Zoogloeaceae bacterium]